MIESGTEFFFFLELTKCFPLSKESDEASVSPSYAFTK